MNVVKTLNFPRRTEFTVHRSVLENQKYKKRKDEQTKADGKLRVAAEGKMLQKIWSTRLELGIQDIIKMPMALGNSLNLRL